MDFSKVLEYQKKDLDLIKLERKLSLSENKAIYTKMYNIVKQAQNKSAELENTAKALVEEIESLKSSYNDNVNSATKIFGRNLETTKDEDLETIAEISKAISNNLSIIERKIMQFSEKLNQILIDFNQTKAKNAQAIDKYKHHKDLYDAEKEKLEPEMEKVRKELLTLEKSVPENLMVRYKKSRQDNVYPVFVQLNNKCCGGCSMELSAISLEKLKKDGFLECEHCRRIILN